MFENILSGIIVFVLTASATYICTKIYPWYKECHIFRRMESEITIFPSKVEMSDLDPYKSGTLSIPLGDALALSKVLFIITGLRKKNKKDYFIVNNPNTWDRNKLDNLIIIGGPMYNQAARCILKEISSKLPYQFKRVIDENYNDVDIKYKSLICQRNKGIQISVTEHLDNDYGTLIVVRNPYNIKKWVILIAGLSPTSTYGAIKSLEMLTFSTAMKYRNKEFQLIIKCVGSNSDCNYEIIDKHLL